MRNRDGDVRPHDDDPPTRVSRRTFLGVTGGVVGSAALAGTSVWTGAPGARVVTAAGTSPAATRTMIVQLARVGAQVPIPFPDFGEPGPASSRATLPRLQAAERRLTAERRALVRAGAQRLIDDGLLDAEPARLVQGVGHLAAEGDDHQQRALTAAVALAVATVSTHFAPHDDRAAQVWIGGLRRLHQRGRLPAAVEQLTITRGVEG
jgi:hypothetical protein